jgi:hypothetical protein
VARNWEIGSPLEERTQRRIRPGGKIDLVKVITSRFYKSDNREMHKVSSGHKVE